MKFVNLVGKIVIITSPNFGKISNQVHNFIEITISPEIRDSLCNKRNRNGAKSKSGIFCSESQEVSGIISDCIQQFVYTYIIPTDRC